MRVTVSCRGTVAHIPLGDVGCEFEWCVSRVIARTFLWRSDCGQKEARCQEKGSQEDCKEDRQEGPQEGREERHQEEGQAQGQEDQEEGLRVSLSSFMLPAGRIAQGQAGRRVN
jgi:hypothetical protein